MAKLYFKYGAMGSSKTAQALITKYNYEENDLSVWLIKPSADTRDGASTIRSRIGLEAQCEVIAPDVDIFARFLGGQVRRCHVIIAEQLFYALFHDLLAFIHGEMYTVFVNVMAGSQHIVVGIGRLIGEAVLLDAAEDLQLVGICFCFGADFTDIILRPFFGHAVTLVEIHESMTGKAQRTVIQLDGLCDHFLYRGTAVTVSGMGMYIAFNGQGQTLL